MRTRRTNKNMSIPLIYVINLKRVPERRLYMQRQLDAFNLDYQIVDAIDKHDLLSKEYRMKIAHQLGISESWMEEAHKKIADNGWVVSLSHIKVYNIMKKDNISMACILEDDVYLLPDFPKILRDSQKISWDTLQLSSWSPTLLDNLRKIIDMCPGYSPCPKPFFINLLRVFKELGHYTLRLPLYTAWRLVATVAEIIYESITGYFYFLVFGRPTVQHYYERIKTSIYIYEASNYIGVHCATKIGGLPIWNKKSWHKLGFKYRIVIPQEVTCFMGGYMITLKMANTFKQVLSTEHIPIDYLFYRLAKRGMKSYVLSPPCIETVLRYFFYSTKSS